MAVPTSAREALEHPKANFIVRALGSGRATSDVALSGGVSAETVEAVQAAATSALTGSGEGGFAQNMLRSLERVAGKALVYYDRALDNGTVNPTTVPLGLGILLTKRSELALEANSSIPTGSTPSADRLFASLLEEPDASVLTIPPLRPVPEGVAPLCDTSGIVRNNPSVSVTEEGTPGEGVLAPAAQPEAGG